MAFGITDPGQGPNKTSSFGGQASGGGQNNPLDWFQTYQRTNKLGGDASAAYNAFTNYINGGMDSDSATSQAVKDIWGDTPNATLPGQSNSSGSSFTSSGNAQNDWQMFKNSQGWNGQWLRSNMPSAVSAFNQAFPGYNFTAGHPNASGQVDVVGYNNRLFDILHGGDDADQWLDVTDEGDSNPQSSRGQTLSSPSGSSSAPPIATRSAAATAPLSVYDIGNSAGLNSSYTNALADLLAGKTASAETVDPNDPTIKNQVNAFQGARQLQDRRNLAAMAEQGGPSANLTGEQRMSSEATGQATGSYQGQLIQNELTSRRQRYQQILDRTGSYLSDQQRGLLQQKIAEIQAAENRYQFDANLQERGWEAGQNFAYLNQQ